MDSLAVREARPIGVSAGGFVIPTCNLLFNFASRADHPRLLVVGEGAKCVSACNLTP
jgi:hypothetical protein